MCAAALDAELTGWEPEPIGHEEQGSAHGDDKFPSHEDEVAGGHAGHL